MRKFFILWLTYSLSDSVSNASFQFHLCSAQRLEELSHRCLIALPCASSSGLQPTISFSDFSRTLLRVCEVLFSPAPKILEIVASLPSSRAGYILYLQANNRKFLTVNLFSSASSSSSLSRISSDSSESSSLLLGSKGRWCCCAADWLRFFCDYSSTIFTAERVPISDLPDNWRSSTTNYYSSEITAQFVTSLRSAAFCSCCSAWRSCGICLRRSGWN